MPFRPAVAGGDSGSSLILDCHGRSVPENAVGRFFDVFAIGESLTPGGDLGLRPALACRILSLFGANVTIENAGEWRVRLQVSFGTSTDVSPAAG